MLLQLKGVLDAAHLDLVRQTLARASFVDGRLSAGENAQGVKRNEELSPQDQEAIYLGKIVMGNVYQHAQFRSAALPLRVSTPFFARYVPGMRYGAHIDDPVMGGGQQRYRSDLALTVFLNDPDHYQGGELTIRTTFGEQRVKLPAGDAVLYPASSLHEVAEVTRGERLVAVAWIQSMIRDATRRDLLYQLDQVRERLRSHAPGSEDATGIDHVYVNLVRLWAEV
jgi:PKHD-type hydroxylase